MVSEAILSELALPVMGETHIALPGIRHIVIGNIRGCTPHIDINLGSINR